jgi:hypothetical protein
MTVGKMKPVIFECPQTGLTVQSIVDEALFSPNTIRILVDCPICSRSHLINPDDFIPPNSGKQNASDKSRLKVQPT